MMRSSKPKVTVEVMRRWSVNEVIDWLQKNDLVDWTKYVRNNSITGQILCELPEGRIMSAPGIPTKQKKDMMTKISKIQEKEEKALKKKPGKNKATKQVETVENFQDEAGDWGSDFLDTDDENSGEDYENIDPNADDKPPDSDSDSDAYLEPEPDMSAPPIVPRRGSGQAEPPRPAKSTTPAKKVPPVPKPNKPIAGRKPPTVAPSLPPRTQPQPEEQETYEIPEDLPPPPVPRRPSGGIQAQSNATEEEEEYTVPDMMGGGEDQEEQYIVPTGQDQEEEYEVPDSIPEPPINVASRQLPQPPVREPPSRSTDRRLPPPPVETEEDYTVPEEMINTSHKRQLPPTPRPPAPPPDETEEEYTVPEESPAIASSRRTSNLVTRPLPAEPVRKTSVPSLPPEIGQRLSKTPESTTKKGSFLHSGANHQRPIQEDSEEPPKSGVLARAKMFENSPAFVPPVPKVETPPRKISVPREQPPVSPISPNRPAIDIPTQRPPPPIPNGGSQISKTRSSSISELRPLPPVPPVESEEADPLYDYPWYFGNKKREEIVPLLTNAGDGVFCVRKSDRPNQPFSLSLWYSNKCWHLPIRLRPDQKYALGSKKENEEAFHSVPEIVQYHQANQLSLTSRANDKNKGGAVYLVKPPRR